MHVEGKINFRLYWAPNDMAFPKGIKYVDGQGFAWKDLDAALAYFGTEDDPKPSQESRNYEKQPLTQQEIDDLPF